LIDDLLNLSRITRTPLVREVVDLSRMAREVAAELQQAHPDRVVQWKIADNLSALGDVHLLRVALDNLLGNAWKFTAKCPQALIELGVSLVEKENVFFVRDNGAGFDMAYANKLFGAFQRLHTVQEFEGIGIGLATVQRVIHRHGGRVWAEGAVSRGATFYFTLDGGGTR
jgi:light-regulated signal transduction histidine kinase (bacteriophytochrome)